ncbi:hypothetical protein OAG56_03750 [Mariniblastus sp.]|nr:hypothetical protein [Mariniblastus sp.]MDB4756462.1 hypothetical protein [Mariniblastus sp.]
MIKTKVPRKTDWGGFAIGEYKSSGHRIEGSLHRLLLNVPRSTNTSESEGGDKAIF